MGRAMDKRTAVSILEEILGDTTPANEEARVAWTRQEIHRVRAEMVRARGLQRMADARGFAERYRNLIRVLGALTGRKLPVPPMAACLRLPG